MKIQCNSFLWPCRRVFANGHLEQLREMVARAELKLPSKEELEKGVQDQAVVDVAGTA